MLVNHDSVAFKNALLQVRAVLKNGAFPPTAGDFMRMGKPTSNAVAGQDFSDPAFLKQHIARAASHYTSPNLDAVTLSCFYPIVRALVVVPLASLLIGDITFAPNLATTKFSLNNEGEINGVWLSGEGRTGSLEARCWWMGVLIAQVLEKIIPAIRTDTRLSERTFTRAASMPVANSLTHIGRAIGNLRAQNAAEMVLRAGSPLLHPVSYIQVVKDGRSYFAVRPLTCCLAYRLHEGKMCAGCPREAEPKRTDNYIAWLKEKL